MRCVIVESRFMGDPAIPAGEPGSTEYFQEYARAAMADCLARGEAPFASHLLYTQPGVLNDNIPAERTKGIAAGLELGKRMDATVVYNDLGISGGMAQGINAAHVAKRLVEYRYIGRPWSLQHPTPQADNDDGA